MDTKRRYITALEVAKGAVDATNKPKDKGYLSFFTPSGIVVGKMFRTEPINFKDVSELSEKITQMLDEKKDVNLFDITAGVYNHLINQDPNLGDKTLNDSKSLLLEDVTIYKTGSPDINVNFFVLFSDQVTGIIPGKVSIS